MKFNLIDKIELLTDDRIVAVKYVTLAEEYLEEHFPGFPVLPGVMMLEALTQAAGWLLHHRSGFAKTMTVIKDVRNVKYGNFVAPGNGLRVDVQLVKATESGGSFKVSGTVNEQSAVAGRVEMAYFNLADKSPTLGYLDEKIMVQVKRRWQDLTQGSEFSADRPTVSLS